MNGVAQLSIKFRNFNILAAFLALCVSMVLVQSYLPNNAPSRFETPACMMLAALPHRRLPGESPARAQTVGPETLPAAGFTLVELSIVLVIIGLVVGGVLAGRDLITAAEMRAQITQIEKYNSAVNTFKGKFNAIPGDMRPEIASQFGFTVGNGCDGSQGGWRDGNELIDDYKNLLPGQGTGETALFWEDLSSNAGGQLIQEQFPNSGAIFNCNIPGGLASPITSTLLGGYFPAAKLGRGNYIYVYENGVSNWFGLSQVYEILSGGNSYRMDSSVDITVAQAYKIDLKIDDGLPASGNVQALYVSTWLIKNAPNNATAGGDSTTCYDTTTGTYSINVNNGNGTNCALSFKMQGAGP